MTTEPIDDQGEVFEPLPDEPAEVELLDTNRSRRVAKAWKLHVRDGYSIGETARRLNVSRNTAWRMAQEGKAQVALLPWLQREELRHTQKAALRSMYAWLMQDAEAESGRAMEYVPILLKVLAEARAVDLHGMPVEHLIKGRIGPDPEFIAALEATMQEDQERTSS